MSTNVPAILPADLQTPTLVLLKDIGVGEKAWAGPEAMFANAKCELFLAANVVVDRCQVVKRPWNCLLIERRPEGFAVTCYREGIYHTITWGKGTLESLGSPGTVFYPVIAFSVVSG